MVTSKHLNANGQQQICIGNSGQRFLRVCATPLYCRGRGIFSRPLPCCVPITSVALILGVLGSLSMDRRPSALSIFCHRLHFRSSGQVDRARGRHIDVSLGVHTGESLGRRIRITQTFSGSFRLLGESIALVIPGFRMWCAKGVAKFAFSGVAAGVIVLKQHERSGSVWQVVQARYFFCVQKAFNVVSALKFS
eukprot:COSAG01_NODE_3048_length_6669_cov_138.195282_10_plen_193_part_00